MGQTMDQMRMLNQLRKAQKDRDAVAKQEIAALLKRG